MILASAELKDVLKSWKHTAFRDSNNAFCFIITEDGTLVIFSDCISSLKGYNNNLLNEYTKRVKDVCNDIKEIKFVEVQIPYANPTNLRSWK